MAFEIEIILNRQLADCLSIPVFITDIQGNLIFYNGDKFSQWKGNLIMGTMTKSVLRATFDAQGNPTSQERMLTELNQRFRDTRVDPDGFIYLLTDETFGAILKVEPGQ